MRFELPEFELAEQWRSYCESLLAGLAKKKATEDRRSIMRNLNGKVREDYATGIAAFHNRKLISSGAIIGSDKQAIKEPVELAFYDVAKAFNYDREQATRWGRNDSASPSNLFFLLVFCNLKEDLTSLHDRVEQPEHTETLKFATSYAIDTTRRRLAKNNKKLDQLIPKKTASTPSWDEIEKLATFLSDPTLNFVDKDTGPLWWTEKHATAAASELAEAGYSAPLIMQFSEALGCLKLISTE